MILFFLCIPIYVVEGGCIPSNFVVEVFLHDWLVVCLCGLCCHPRCDSVLLRTNAAWVDNKSGVCWKCGQSFYAWCVPKSAMILICAGRGRVLGSEVVSSWWLFTWRTEMVAGKLSLTVYASCMMSQSGWRHCWMENGVSWDRLTTPRLSIWSSDVMYVAFVQGGKHVNTVSRA